MKKAKPAQDQLHSDYRREDFGVMTRGKYADRCRKASNVVVISPEVQKAFPNAQAVNDDTARLTGTFFAKHGA